MKISNKDFVHLHQHSEFSLGDGLCKLHDLVMANRRMGFSAMALTDHGNMGGAIKLIQECEMTKDKNDKQIPYPTIKPIIGEEFYMSANHKEKNEDGKKGNRHLILLAKNFNGYKNLCTLSHLSWSEGVYYSPRVDFDLLSKYSDGIIATSACISSLINANLAFDRYEKAKEAASLLKDIYGDDFYLVVQMHGIGRQMKILPLILKLGKELDIKVIADNDVHYLEKEHAASHELFLCMQRQTCLKDPKHAVFPYPEFYLKSAEEMASVFPNNPEVIFNTLEIAEKVDTDDIKKNLFGGMRLPKFPIPEQFKTETEYVEFLAMEGMKRLGWDKSPRHMAQVKIELEDLKIALEVNGYNFITYFLIVQDIVDFAKSKKILVGDGRGCLLPEIPILTDRGYVPIGKIREGDRVGTKNGSFRLVKKAHEYKCKEELVNINTYYGDEIGVTLTGDHKVFAEKSVALDQYKRYLERGATYKYPRKMYKNPTGDLKWIQAKNVKTNDWLFVPFLKDNGAAALDEKIDLWDVSQNDYRLSLDLKNEQILETRYVPCGNGIRSVKKVPRYIKKDEHFAWILGKFVADGWTCRGKMHRNHIGFAFNSDEIDQTKYVEDYFKNYGFMITSRRSKTRKLIQIDVKSIVLYKLFSSIFELYAQTSETKYIPQSIFGWDKKLKLAFIQGAFAGDGSMKAYNHKFVYTTVSKSLAYGVRHMLWLLRIPNALKKEKNRNDFQINTPTIQAIVDGIKGYKIPTVPTYEDPAFGRLNHCRIIDNGFLVRVRKVSCEKYDGPVYDLSVEGERNYLTSSFLVHNSGYASVLLRCLKVTYGLDPIEFGLLWQRFLAFSEVPYIKENDFGFETEVDLSQVETDEEEAIEEEFEGAF